VCLVLDLVPKSITWSYQYALGLVILHQERPPTYVDASVFD